MLKRCKEFFDKLKLKIMFVHSGSHIGKIISANNPQYISVGKNVRIKDYCRIDCYKFFGGGKI